MYVRICLVPDEIKIGENPYHLHPNLLHINMRTNKKKRKLQVRKQPHLISCDLREFIVICVCI